jgi:hypothetical protein
VHRRGTKSPGRRDSNPPLAAHPHHHQGHPAHSQLPPVPHQSHHPNGAAHHTPTAQELAIAAQQAESLRLHAHHLHPVSSSVDSSEIDPHTLVHPIQAEQTNSILEQTKPWLQYDSAYPPATIHGEAEALLADMIIPKETWHSPSKHAGKNGESPSSIEQQRVLRPSSQSPPLSHPLSRGPHHAPNNSISLNQGSLAAIHATSGRGGHHAPNNSISFASGTSLNDSPQHRPHWRDNSIPFLNDPIEENEGLLRDVNGESHSFYSPSPQTPSHSKRGGHHAPQNSIIFPHGTSFAPSPSSKSAVGHHAPQNSLAFNPSTIAAIRDPSPSSRSSTFNDHPILHQQWPSQSSGLQRSFTGLSMSAEENGGTPKRVDSLGIQRSNSNHTSGGTGSLQQVQSKFANVNALLESALQDARTPALTHQTKRSGSFKQLHPAPSDGRSTGAGSIVPAHKHTRRPSTSLVSSVVADEYDNQLHERISDRLESNRLEIDPELRRKHSAMLAKGVPAPVAPPEPELSMAHWAAQIHEQILLEKKEAERLEAEEAERTAAEKAPPTANGATGLPIGGSDHATAPRPLR